MYAMCVISLSCLLVVHSIAKNGGSLINMKKVNGKKGKYIKYLLRVEAIAGNTLKDAVDIGRGTHKLVSPKIVGGVANEFDKRDENAPRMRFQQNQPFHQNTSNLLLDVAVRVALRLQLTKQE